MLLRVGAPGSWLATPCRAHLAVPRCTRQCIPVWCGPVGRRLLGAMALGLVSVSLASPDITLGGRLFGLLHRHVRFLLVAPLASSRRLPLVGFPPDPSQPPTHRIDHVVLQTPPRDDCQFDHWKPTCLHVAGA